MLSTLCTTTVKLLLNIQYCVLYIFLPIIFIYYCVLWEMCTSSTLYKLNVLITFFTLHNDKFTYCSHCTPYTAILWTPHLIKKYYSAKIFISLGFSFSHTAINCTVVHRSALPMWWTALYKVECLQKHRMRWWDFYNLFSQSICPNETGRKIK